MKKIYCNIVFMQGSEANEVINFESPEEKMEHLKQWDDGEYHEIATRPYHASSNEIMRQQVECGMNYVLTESRNFESVSLTLVLTEDHKLFHILNDKTELYNESDLAH